MWVTSAAVVGEVVSPDDESYAKFGFYAAHGVEEIVVANPRSRSVRCFHAEGGHFIEGPGSELLGVRADELTAAIDWPARP